MARYGSSDVDRYGPLSAPPIPARFLLTFDDGPHANTPCILKHLACNSIQRHVKGLFFVQTRAACGGGTEVGRRLLKREHLEGHTLGLHTATPAGHVSHTRLGRSELEQSLSDGIDDLMGLTGAAVKFVRPPYWCYNQTILGCYRSRGLHMLLSEVKAYDGVNWGFHMVRRWNLRFQLRRVSARCHANHLPVMRGCIPIVVTFHDTNAYTAVHLDDYLALLLEESALAGIEVAGQPFYDDPLALTEAAQWYASHQTKERTGACP